MPQALSKFRQPVNRPVSVTADEVQRKRRRCNTCKKYKPHEKLPPIAGRTPYLPHSEEEDWEKEIEEFSHRMKQEKMKEMPYDPEDELKVAMDEMTLYAVPRAPMPNQDHYSPSKHHVPPVKWTRYIYTKVPDQFKDAEE